MQHGAGHHALQSTRAAFATYAVVNAARVGPGGRVPGPAILGLVSETRTKTIYEWAGGTEAFERWLNAFYDLVEEDEGLAPLFGGEVSERTATTSSPGGSR